MKLNSNGRLVKHSYSNLRRFNALLLIMKTTSIMIYDRELKYKRHIQHGSEGEIRHVSTNIHGNFYVTDFGRSFVLMFSNDGTFV